MLAPQLTPSTIAAGMPVILQFPTEAIRPVRSLRHMTTQLLQEAAQVIPNQQLLINVVSKRVRQLGLGHRPMVEVGPRAVLSDIALREILAGNLTFDSFKGSPEGPYLPSRFRARAWPPNRFSIARRSAIFTFS